MGVRSYRKVMASPIIKHYIAQQRVEQAKFLHRTRALTERNAPYLTRA